MADEEQAREEARQKAEDEINLVWTESETCPICGRSEWTVLNLVDIPVRTITDSAAAWSISPALTRRTAYVFAPVTCANCGLTRFFHTGALGVAAGQARERRKLGER
jgi:hypothetical protein